MLDTSPYAWKPCPFALCTKDKNVIYVDKDLEQLHELVLGGKVTKY